MGATLPDFFQVCQLNSQLIVAENRKVLEAQPVDAQQVQSTSKTSINSKATKTHAR